mgnify:CR=1 FL=1
MKAPAKKRTWVLSRLAAMPKNFLLQRRTSRMPERSKGWLLYGLWQYVDPKTFGFKGLPRTTAKRRGGLVHLLRKYIPGRVIKKVTSIDSAGFELTIGVSFYTHRGALKADVFIVPKPHLAASKGRISIKEPTSSMQRTAFEEEKKNLERAVRMLAENLGIKEPERIEINFLAP